MIRAAQISTLVGALFSATQLFASTRLLQRDGSFAVELAAVTPIPPVAGLPTMRGTGPWTLQALRLPFWNNYGQVRRFIYPFNSMAPKHVDPRNAQAEYVLHATLRYDVTGQTPAASSAQVDWIPAQPLPPPRYVRASKQPRIPLVSTDLTKPGDTFEPWIPESAVGYFALPQGVPGPLSPHGRVVQFQIDVDWPVTQRAMEIRTARILFERGSIDPKYINATYAIGAPTRLRPQATLRVDFTENPQAVNGPRMIGFVFGKSVLTKPVSTVRVGDQDFDAVEIAFSDLDFEIDGRRAYALWTGP